MAVAERPRTGLVTWVRDGLRFPAAAATFGVGAAAIALAILGPLLVTASFGFTPFERIVEALRSRSMELTLIAAIALGAVGVAVGFSIYRRMPTKRSREQAIAGGVLGIQAVLLGAFLLWFSSRDPESFVRNFLDFDVLEGQLGAFLRGARNTIVLAVAGEVGGIFLGLVLAILVLSKRRVVRAPARAYINFFRGTPLIWQLSIFFFGISLGLGFRPAAPGFSAAYTSAMIVFALNTGAYAAEVFRAGIQSIERGQMEAARSLGMSYLQAMRYAIVPQAFRRVIPPLMNEFVILIKDTSLIIVLGLTQSDLDIFSVARQGYAATFSATFFVAAALGYLAVTLPLIRLVNIVERRLRSGLVSVA